MNDPGPLPTAGEREEEDGPAASPVYAGRAVPKGRGRQRSSDYLQ